MRSLHDQFQLRDRDVYLLLLAVSILVRIPFLKTYDMVTYDGTYYINEAMSILGIIHRPSGFPIGYPIFIALLMPLIHDGVRAAQTVSFLAGLGSLFVFYSLARRFVQRSNAFVAVFLLALTPLFINLSTVTMSESIYVLWMLLGLYCFSRDNDMLSGLFLGMAAITRPEALGILGVLAALRIRRPRRFLRVMAGFVVVYCVNVTAQSSSAGKLILVPKANLFGTSASYWKLREAWIDFPGREKALEAIAKEKGRTTVIVDYLKRMPQEFVLLIQHVSPVVFLLSLYGIWRRRLFLLASFVPFFAFPLFTFRSESRFVLPYIPVLILYSLIGIEGLRNRKFYRPLYILLFVYAAAAFFINRTQLTIPDSGGYEWAKEVGMEFRGKVKPWDKIADRKPFFAFYAGGQYVEIPVAPYDDTLEHLATHGVQYLVLHGVTIHMARPNLRPLLYDRAVAMGEMRYSQLYFKPGVVAIYERTKDSKPLERRHLLSPVDARISGLSWSPDGRTIAYHLIEPSGAGGIYFISPEDGQSRCVVAGADIEDQIAWAPDSKRIAFAMQQGDNIDIYVRHESGKLERITSHPGTDKSPSWSRDGKEIVFCSKMSGRSEIWLKELETGALKQITTDGGNNCPTISPDGKRIAWIRDGEALCVYDRRRAVATRFESPKKVYFAPAWSPDGNFIAVTGLDWGKTDIYVVTADGGKAALLTKSTLGVGVPTWSSDGLALAAITLQDEKMGIAILTGIQPYKDRLMSPMQINVFPPLALKESHMKTTP